MVIISVIESAIIILGLFFAILPLRESLRLKSLHSMIIAVIAVSAFTFSCSILRKVYSLGNIAVLLIEVPGFLAAYMLLIDAGTGRKLFCFCNGLMLCSFCPLYAVFIIAPFYTKGISCAVCLGLELAVCAIFFKTLTHKLPMLMEQEYISSVWEFLFIVPLFMGVLMMWAVPIHPELATVGRLRPVALVILWLVLMVIWLLYHVFWWTAAKLTEGARLREANTLLSMESKRYHELRSYMDSTRAMRHDFRHHIMVITQLAGTGKLTELQSYLQQFTDSMETGYTGYCWNASVDAVASHYTAIAESRGGRIDWHLNLPAQLPINEPEYCAVLGNLVENAINALPQGGEIKVISSLLSKKIIGLTVDNAFCGEIAFGKDGLPVSGREGHGTGLRSVRSTVERYGGTMTIHAEGGIFSVEIIFYCETGGA